MAKDVGDRQRVQLPFLAISGCGKPMSFAGSAPGLGRIFCVRPPYVSAAYIFPSESTENPCTAQNWPGPVPCWPHMYNNLPFKSYSRNLSVDSSATQRCWSFDI